MSEEGRFTIHTALFEGFCVVSASIRQGIPIKVSIQDQAGKVLHRSE